jgi:hypothetical protein
MPAPVQENHVDPTIIVAIAGGICAVVVIGVIVLGLFLFVLKKAKPKVDPEARLDEDLSEYPPPPKAGTHRLTFEGRPVRIRLVVLAPVGKNVELDASMAEGVLESVLHGLGSAAQLDKPRVRIWPPPLSQKGFAPTFHRHVTRPEGKDEDSPWILPAGPARAGNRPVLLGLALLAEEASARGQVVMEMEQWADKLRVQVVG